MCKRNRSFSAHEEYDLKKVFGCASCEYGSNRSVQTFPCGQQTETYCVSLTGSGFQMSWRLCTKERYLGRGSKRCRAVGDRSLFGVGRMSAGLDVTGPPQQVSKSVLVSVDLFRLKTRDFTYLHVAKVQLDPKVLREQCRKPPRSGCVVWRGFAVHQLASGKTTCPPCLALA